jgi:hypothetical protein
MPAGGIDDTARAPVLGVAGRADGDVVDAGRDDGTTEGDEGGAEGEAVEGCEDGVDVAEGRLDGGFGTSPLASGLVG